MKCNICNNEMINCEMFVNNERVEIIDNKNNKTYHGGVYICNKCGFMKLDLDMYTEPY